MKIIDVKASKPYKVYIQSGILSKAAEYISPLGKYQKIAIVTDDIVDSLYSKTLENRLKNFGYEVIKFVIKNGEASKNAENYIELINFLAINHLTRSDLVIALGGGVVGDLTGFAAATFLRGIDYVQIPTTLLAMVDSSVGGKTAIDIKAGKNLCGSFYQPRLVLCDTETLKTLPENIFSDGCAEVIKYAILGNKELFDHLKQNGLDFDKDYVISECVRMKSEIVENDEFDTGMRQLLNFGHTVGHAVEILSDFEISHGSAVAIGMCIVTKACATEFYDEVKTTIEKFKLPTKTNFKAEELTKIMLSDKKRFGDTINLIVPEYIGKCVIKPVKIDELNEIVNKGL